MYNHRREIIAELETKAKTEPLKSFQHKVPDQIKTVLLSCLTISEEYFLYLW